jgi:hypothetical protein
MEIGGDLLHRVFEAASVLGESAKVFFACSF